MSDESFEVPEMFFVDLVDEYSIRRVGPFGTQKAADDWERRHKNGEVPEPTRFIPHSARMELAMRLGHGGPIRNPERYFGE